MPRVQFCRAYARRRGAWRSFACTEWCDADGCRYRSERVIGNAKMVPCDFLRAVGDSASSASDSPASSWTPWPLNTNSRIVARRRGRSHCGRNSRASSWSSGAGECVSSQGLSIACAVGLKPLPSTDQQTSNLRSKLSLKFNYRVAKTCQKDLFSDWPKINGYAYM